MYAIEFKTIIKNGIIHIPGQYKELQQKDSVRVLIMVEEAENDILSAESEKNRMVVSDSTDTFFDKFQIDTTKYKFDRDEANER